MPPGSFRVLNSSFIKKNVEHLETERLQKKRYQQIIFIFRKFKKQELYFGTV